MKNERKDRNIISDHLFSKGGDPTCSNGVGGDCIFFSSDGPLVTDPVIGTPCTLGPNFCIEETGDLQDVTAMIAAQNGGLIAGGSTIQVASDIDIPEPAILSLLIPGLAGLGFSRHKQG